MATTIANALKRTEVSMQEVFDIYLYGLSMVAESVHKSEVLEAVYGISNVVSDLRADIVDSGNTLGELYVIRSGKHSVIFEEYEDSGCGKMVQDVYLYDAESGNMYSGATNSKIHPVVAIGLLEGYLRSDGR